MAFHVNQSSFLPIEQGYVIPSGMGFRPTQRSNQMAMAVQAIRGGDRSSAWHPSPNFKSREPPNYLTESVDSSDPKKFPTISFTFPPNGQPVIHRYPYRQESHPQNMTQNEQSHHSSCSISNQNLSHQINELSTTDSLGGRNQTSLGAYSSTGSLRHGPNSGRLSHVQCHSASSLTTPISSVQKQQVDEPSETVILTPVENIRKGKKTPLKKSKKGSKNSEPLKMSSNSKLPSAVLNDEAALIPAAAVEAHSSNNSSNTKPKTKVRQPVGTVKNSRRKKDQTIGLMSVPSFAPSGQRIISERTVERDVVVAKLIRTEETTEHIEVTSEVQLREEIIEEMHKVKEHITEVCVCVIMTLISDRVRGYIRCTTFIYVFYIYYSICIICIK